MAKRWGVSACGLSAASLATLFAGVGLSATLMASGMAGSGIATPDIGIYSFPSQVGIGTVGLAQNALRIGGNVTAVAGAAAAIRVLTTQVASANGDTLRGIHVGFNSTPGAFTALQAKGAEIQGFSTAGFTSPADPIVLDIGGVTGSGITANAVNAFGIRIAPPVGAANNYLISHTTPGTFNVSASGNITAQSLVVANGVTLSGGLLTLQGYGAGTGVVGAGIADSGGSGFRMLRVPN